MMSAVQKKKKKSQEEAPGWQVMKAIRVSCTRVELEGGEGASLMENTVPAKYNKYKSPRLKAGLEGPRAGREQ